MGEWCRRRGVKISPQLCHSQSELLVPEMLPLTSSQGSNTDPDSSICVRSLEESQPIGFASAQSSSCNLFLSPGLPLDKLGPVPATQALCLAPDLWFQALLGLWPRTQRAEEGE